MEFKEFYIYVSSFLEKKGWEITENNNEVSFTKNYNPASRSKKSIRYLLNDDLFFHKLSESFKQTGLKSEVLHSMKNENADTDLIIAGLQIANNFLKNDETEHKSFYSFQPVTRLNRTELCGKEEGFLTSFVNLCTVDIDTSPEEYIKRIDDWLTILSDLSLHSSGIKLEMKKIKNDRIYNGLNFSNGRKLKFSYKGIDVGVANLFDVGCKDKQILLSDIGFSYERLLWCINGKGSFYTPLYPNFEVLYGDYKKNDRIRTATLMGLSGIKPSANGVGSKMRNIIRESSELGDGDNVNNMVKHYYAYYSKFIKPHISLENTLDMILDETIQNKKRIITNQAGISLNYDKSIEELCEMRIIKEEINKQKLEKSKKDFIMPSRERE